MKRICNKCHQASLLFCLLLTTASVSYSKQYKDTVFFEYNSTKEELTIWTNKSHPNIFPYYKIKQNSFTEKLFNKLNGLNSYKYWEGMGESTLPYDGEAVTIKSFRDFDSASCVSMKVRMNGDDISDNIFYDVVVRYIADTIPAVEAAPVEVKQNEAKNFDLMKILPLGSAIAALIVFIIVISIIISRHNRKKQQDVVKPITKTKSIEVVEEVKNNQVQGLDFVKSNFFAYYHIDLQKDFADTAVHSIYIHHSAVKKMYDFFKRSLESGDITNETGCYFVGCWEYDTPDQKSYNISLEDIVEPGDDLEPGEFSFNFGLKIGVKLSSAIEKLSRETGLDYVHTVWMHSHPGLGLFLSSHDLVVQRQLAYSDAKNRLVAFVVDTNTPNLDLAIFSAKANGSMNNKEDLHHLYSLESLYLWSRKAHAAITGAPNASENNIVPPPVDLNKYHALQVNHQGNSRTLNVYLGSSVINAIDDLLYEYEGKHTLAGYFYGTKDYRGNIVVNECLHASDDNKPDSDPLGLFIVDSERNMDILTAKYLKDTSATCVFIGQGEDELTIMTRENNSVPFPPISEAVTCSMKPMKEWLRRRRVYK